MNANTRLTIGDVAYYHATTFAGHGQECLVVDERGAGVFSSSQFSMRKGSARIDTWPHLHENRWLAVVFSDGFRAWISEFDLNKK